MNYSEAKDYLTKLDTFGSVLGLSRMRELVTVLNDPQNDTDIIHITGTNGKGSILCFLSYIMKKQGLVVGSFSSPAVAGVRDCFRIDNEIISEELFAECTTDVKNACDFIIEKGHEHPTRFEVETAIAFLAFKKSKCNIAIVETGLGGEGDSTNVIDNAVMNIFASISLDHVKELGPDIKSIARNKAGIIKSSAPVIICANNEEATAQVENRASEYNAKVYKVLARDITNKNVSEEGITFDFDGINNIHVSMCGAYQYINAAVAIKAMKILYNTDSEIIKNGLHNTKWPFRFERISSNPLIYLDGAHNEDAALKLRETLDNLYKDRYLIFVIGIFKDKDYDRICEITLPIARKVFVTKNDLNKRSMSAEELFKVALKYNKNSEIKNSVDEAVKASVAYADSNKDKEPIIVMFGSLSWLDKAKKIIGDFDLA